LRRPAWAVMTIAPMRQWGAQMFRVLSGVRSTLHIDPHGVKQSVILNESGGVDLKSAFWPRKGDKGRANGGMEGEKRESWVKA